MSLFGLFGMRRRRHRSRGQSLAEFALVLPVLLLIVMIGLDFGRVFLGWVNLNQAARIGANYAAMNPNANWTASTQRTQYNKLIEDDAAAINCQLPADPPPPVFSASPARLGDTVTVTISCEFTLLTPLISAVLPNPLPVSAEAQWPIRTGAVGAGGGTAVVGTPPAPSPTPATPTATPTATATATPTASPTSGPTPVPAPIARFYATSSDLDSSGGGATETVPLLGVAPLNVTFTDTSTGDSITAWAWTFGDGNTSTDRHPTHVYRAPGRYRVELTVTNPGGADVESKNNYIEVGCKIPNLHTMTEAQARAAWLAAGFNPSRLSFNPNPFGSNTVVRQDQPGGKVLAFNQCSSTRMTVFAS